MKIMENNNNNELKKIELQLNQHLLSKKGSLKHNRVSLTTKSNYFNSENMDLLLNKEIKSVLCGKKWNGLPLFLKWSGIKTYLEKNNIIDPRVVDNLKHLVSKNKLVGIVYDHSVQEITKIPDIYLIK